MTKTELINHLTDVLKDEHIVEKRVNSLADEIISLVTETGFRVLPDTLLENGRLVGLMKGPNETIGIWSVAL
jgi:hypothetical protein